MLEVLVAVVVMTAGIIPLLVTHSASIRNFTRSKMVTQASLLAESRLAMMESTEFKEPVSREGEDEELPYLFCQEEVTPVAEEVMAKMEVKVTRPGAKEEASPEDGVMVDLISYVANLKFGEEESKEGKKGQ